MGRQILVNKALIIGSSPVSSNIAKVDLDGYHKIAVNKSWRIRRDFDTHVYLQSLSDEDRPPLTSVSDSIGVSEFTKSLRKAGGLYLTSGSVAMISGYWAVINLGAEFISYYGCDLVYETGTGEKTHFYGNGDEGPLVGNFKYNLRQRERSIRLLCWGLIHNVVFTNSSALDGSLLAFPKASLFAESNALCDDILSSRETQRLVRKAGNLLAFEMKAKTPAFSQKQIKFEQDENALSAMMAILDGWAELESAVQDYVSRVEELFEASRAVKASRRRESPAELLQKTESSYDLALHLGFHKTASTSIQKILEAAAPELRKQGCQIVPHQKLRNNYTRLAEIFAQQSVGIMSNDPLNAQLFRELTQEFFVDLNIKPNTRVVLSEENAAGHVGQCAFPGLLYRFPKQYLGTFASNLPVEPREVHVAIRNYAPFFASCYTEYLGSVQKERFILPQVMVAKVMANLPSWVDLLENLRLCFPQSEIHVWCFEDFRSNISEFFEILTDVPGDTFNWQERFRVNARPSAGAEVVSFLLSGISSDGVAQGLENWKALKKTGGAFPSEHKRFNPWQPHQEKHLDALYKRDITRISEDCGFILHRPTAQKRNPKLELADND